MDGLGKRRTTNWRRRRRQGRRRVGKGRDEEMEKGVSRRKRDEGEEMIRYWPYRFLQKVVVML